MVQKVQTYLPKAKDSAILGQVARVKCRLRISRKLPIIRCLMEFLSKIENTFFISKDGYNIGLEYWCKDLTPPPPPLPPTFFFLFLFFTGRLPGGVVENIKKKKQ